MNIQEKAEQYAREKLGNWCHIVHSAYEISQCTNGEVTVNDYLVGYNEAKRWIPVGERLPDSGGLFIVKVKSEYGRGFYYELADFDNAIEPLFFIQDTDNELDVIEWREI